MKGIRPALLLSFLLILAAGAVLAARVRPDSELALQYCTCGDGSMSCSWYDSSDGCTVSGQEFGAYCDGNPDCVDADDVYLPPDEYCTYFTCAEGNLDEYGECTSWSDQWYYGQSCFYSCAGLGQDCDQDSDCCNGLFCDTDDTGTCQPDIE